MLAASRDALATARAAVLSDYGKGVLDERTIAAVIGEARKAGVAIVVDPKKADAAIFAGATVVTPNIDEMTQFSGIRDRQRRSCGGGLPCGPRARRRSTRSW